MQAVELGRKVAFQGAIWTRNKCSVIFLLSWHRFDMDDQEYMKLKYVMRDFLDTKGQWFFLLISLKMAVMSSFQWFSDKLIGKLFKKTSKIMERQHRMDEKRVYQTLRTLRRDQYTRLLWCYLVKTMFMTITTLS